MGTRQDNGIEQVDEMRMLREGAFPIEQSNRRAIMTLPSAAYGQLYVKLQRWSRRKWSRVVLPRLPRHRHRQRRRHQLTTKLSAYGAALQQQTNDLNAAILSRPVPQPQASYGFTCRAYNRNTLQCQ
jgi:hypothetical protein